MSTTPLSLPPGRFGLPLLGETLSFLRDSIGFLRQHQRTYGPVYKTHLFGEPTVVLTGHDAMRFVFAHDKDYFISALPESTVRLLGDYALHVQEGENHQQRRRMLQQVFGHRALTAYVPLMDRIALAHLDAWERRGSFAFCPLLNEFTFHIACALILGTEDNVAELSSLFQVWLAGLFTLPVPLPFTTFGRALKARQGLLDRLDALARERMRGALDGEDALSVLLRATDEQGRKLPLVEVKDIVLHLLSAGHDTSSSALASFCMLTAQHPEVLEKMRAEQRAVEIAGPITFDHLKRMPYLEQVIKEVLRLIPPAGGGFRKVVKPFEFNGYQVPQDWKLMFSISLTHMEAESFREPERFDPDRFSPERAEDKQVRCAWVPFGGGPRTCPGMEYARLEMAVLAARLVRDYAWELTPGQDLSLHTLPTPRPRSGLAVRFWRVRAEAAS